MSGLHRGMAAKDVRMKTCSEVFGSLLSVKLNAWEERFQKAIFKNRGVELIHIWTVFYSTALNVFLLWLAPNLVSVFTILSFSKVSE